MSFRLHRRVVGVCPRSPFHWRLQRGYELSRRLQEEVSAVAVVHGAVCLGSDEAVRRMFDRAGLGSDAVAIVAFQASGHPCTVVVPTFRTWKRQDMHRRILAVAGEVASSGRSMMLVGPHDVTAQPRLDNAELMLRTMRPPAIGDADTILRILETASGEACLAQCKAALAGPSATERIFGLMVGGFVEIGLSIPICAETRVRLRSSGWPFDWIGPRGGEPLAEATPLPRRATGLQVSEVGWGGSQVGHALPCGQPSVPGIGERIHGG